MRGLSMQNKVWFRTYVKHMKIIGLQTNIHAGSGGACFDYLYSINSTTYCVLHMLAAFWEATLEK